GGAYERASGVGPRFYLSFQIPIGLVRVRNTGMTARTSGDFAKMESVSFGAGAAFTAEIWNFNLNAPEIALNPQLNAGIFINSPLSDLSKLSSLNLSYVVGGAFR